MLWREIALPPRLINMMSLLSAHRWQRQNRRTWHLEQYPHHRKIGDEEDNTSDERPDEPPGKSPTLPAPYCKVIDEAKEQR